MFKQALYYPFAKVSRFIGLLLLFAIPVVNTITGIMGLGYLLQTLKKPGLRPPKFGDHLFKDGFRVIFVTIIYFALPVVIYFLPIGSAAKYTSIGLAVLISLIFPSALITLANGKVFDTLKCGPIIRRCLTKDYAVALGWSIVIGMIVDVITFAMVILSAITIVGPVVVVAAASTVWLLSAAYLFGGLDQ